MTSSAIGLTTTAQVRIGVVEGDGHCGMKVAGTSHHQNELEKLAGGRSAESAHFKCAALLLPEPENSYDPNAVAVYIVAHGSKTGIGYLQHDTAPLFNRCLLRDGFSAAGCNALIVGGWIGEGSDDGYFGVRLDAVLPFQLNPLALPNENHAAPIASNPVQIAARPPSAAPKRSFANLAILALIAVGVVVVYSGRGFVSSALLTPTISSPQENLVRFECIAPKANVTHIVEVDGGQVRLWARFSPTLTNGPFGPFPANITPEKISWLEKKTVGKESSMTTYAIERQTYSLNIEIKNSWESDIWREKSPCKAALP